MGDIFRPDFNETQLEGFDIIIKSLNKKFPFIIGWEFTDNDPNKFMSIVGLDVIIDVDKLSDFYNIPVHKYFEEYTFLHYGYGFCIPLYYEDVFNIEERPCYEDYFKFKKLFNKHYKYLPEKYKTFILSKNSDTFKSNVDIDINKSRFIRIK